MPFPQPHRVYPRPYKAAEQPQDERPSYFSGLVHGMILGGIVVLAGMLYALTHSHRPAAPVQNVTPAVEHHRSDLPEPELPCETLHQSA